jgi:hypothetical protein
MSHINKIYDSDPHFTINPITRQITNDSNKKTVLIQNDHNSERFSFRLARFVEGHDMAECNRVEIHFSDNGFEDVHEVDDLQIDTEDENSVVFSWQIRNNATKNVGRLEFSIRFACINDDGSIDYAWHTAIHSGITISKGMNNSEAVVSGVIPDVLAQWKNEILNEFDSAISDALGGSY